jgi:hypothetical protein
LQTRATGQGKTLRGNLDAVFASWQTGNGKVSLGVSSYLTNGSGRFISNGYGRVLDSISLRVHDSSRQSCICCLLRWHQNWTGHRKNYKCADSEYAMPAFQEILSQSFLQKITFNLGSSANVTVECEIGVTPYEWHDTDNG